MDSPEHARSSSSPNAKVSSVSKNGNTAFQVQLEDGSRFFISSDTPGNFYPGMCLSPLQLDSLKTADAEYRCRRKALDLLARAEHSRRGLRLKLLRSGFEADLTDRILDRLESAGLLSDQRYAEQWVRSRLRKHPEGRSLLFSRLKSKGISSELAEDIVNAALKNPEDTQYYLEQVCNKISRRSGITEQKLTAALVRRGFSYSDIQALLREKSGRE